MKKKCNIGFLMINEHSSFNAAFGLARVLKDRGHEVMFFVETGTVFQQYVKEHGFKFINMPPYANYRILDDKKKKAEFMPWKWVKGHVQRVRVGQDSLAALIEKESIDLFFLDNIYSYPFAIAPARMRVPTILLFPNFGSRFKTLYPPVFSSMVPPGGKRPDIRQRFMYFVLWVWATLAKGRSRSYDKIEYMKIVLVRIFRRIYIIGFERKLRKLGWKSTWSEWRRRPIIPEIVMGHRSLDWHAVASNPERCYFGATDHFRKNPDFDWSAIAANDPIVYCNVSTAHGFQQIQCSTQGSKSTSLDFSRNIIRLAKRFLTVTIDAFSRRNDWQLILACGPLFRTLQSASLPANIHFFERVPQLAVLSRADLAITWGGAGTVRECVNFGVPMIIFPAWTDQFGNAARVSFYNLGIRGNLLDVTPEKMIEMVERVLGDKKIKSSVKEMKNQCIVAKEIRDLVNFVSYHTALEL